MVAYLAIATAKTDRYELMILTVYVLSHLIHKTFFSDTVQTNFFFSYVLSTDPIATQRTLFFVVSTLVSM